MFGSEAATPCFTTRVFQDMDEFVAELKRQFEFSWESTQISAGRNVIQLDHLELPELIIARGQVKQSTIESFEVPSKYFFFSISPRKQPIFSCGVEVPPTAMVVYSPGFCGQGKYPKNIETYDFLISERLLRATEIFPPSFTKKVYRTGMHTLPLSPPALDGMLFGLNSFMQSMRERKTAQVEDASFESLDAVILGLQQLVDTGLPNVDKFKPRLTRRADLVAKATDFMRDSLHQNLGAEEIAQHVRVSYRVLNYAFKDAFGISPYKLYLHKRLEAVRRLLKHSEISVEMACDAYGFQTPSRFRRHYRNLFGERPSQTKGGCKGGSPA